MTTISSVVLSMGSSPSKVKTAQRRQEFLGIPEYKRATLSALPSFRYAARPKEPLAASPASAANGNLADLIQSDCACSSWRQINVPARYEGSTIVDPYDHTAMVTNRYAGSKWECTMRCCHGRTIHALTVRGATSTKSVWAAIDAGDFGMRGINHDTRYSGHQ